jgi:phage baseplate assembly protein gpV
VIEETLAEVVDFLTDRKDRFYGVVIGRVREVAGDELAISRVKLELPFLADGELSGWARVAVPMAGSSYGTYFIPNLDDEVLVAFEQGDVNIPYVLGSLWNATARPPVASPLAQHWMIKTRAGSMIDIAEQPPSITIETPTGQKIEMSAEGITVKTGTSSVELTADAVSVKGTRINLEGTSSINLSAPIVRIKGTTATVEASAVCNIKGALVNINS